MRTPLPLLIPLLGVLACSTPPTQRGTSDAARGSDAPVPSTAPQITLGNGAANWIVVEGATREGATLTFREVQIDGNGWLVMHPFKNGRPAGEIYVGATYVADGRNRDVEITLESEPDPGEMFIVMLHRDVNENQEFDFVFVDERNVLDRAVFEGTKMIAHRISAP